MRDEPSNGELARRLVDLQDATLKLMSQELFVAEQRANERRFTLLERDLKGLGERVDNELSQLGVHIESRKRDRGANWRQGVYSGVLPAVLLLISILVQIWLALNGPPW
ncbi:hypothetical protein [Nonomuraea sp. NEAU-A123]|uniref:hypothetical protein n=1 Tax=Nonomuraea sp. NEAU-A123 TaxID=2839649 RepID=UPI001BE4AAE1|nr:hypothetical protein [Nonomuraea sp. NEAU-A123]MBT2230388.1 hypothetical protein [Nonomuraea sp. NEAU-A123]